MGGSPGSVVGQDRSPAAPSAPACETDASGGATPTTTTIGRALRDASVQLAASDTPRLDAELLLGHVLGVPRAQLLARSKDRLTPREDSRMRELVGRRVSGEPIAYILGSRGFFGLDLIVTADVLVPRPETELLAEWAVARLLRRGPEVRVVDVGTGSGALALACLMNVAEIEVHATDLFAAALRVAGENAKRLGLADRLVLHNADLLPTDPVSFDVVVANLPYVALSETDEVASDVLEWEPHEALFGGDDGLDVIRRLLQELPPRLARGADVGFEIGWRHGRAAVEMAAAAFPGSKITLHHDLAGHPRLVTAEGCAKG